MRLIDADALKEVISGNSYMLRDSINSMNFGMFWDGIEQAIDEAPTIDAVPVVRCKDCFLYGECKAAEWYGENGNGYCSVGDRRKDNE